MQPAPLLVVSGPSGVGKGTLCQYLLQNSTQPWAVSISTTTRSPREGEQNGVQYHFVSKAEFEAGVTAGDFYEWAEYNGNYYGTSIQALRQQQEAGKQVILEIEVQGARQVKKKDGKAYLVFVAPPSMAELERRLRGRQTEEEDVIQKRLIKAIEELDQQLDFDQIIVNRFIELSATQLEAGFEAWRRQILQSA